MAGVPCASCKPKTGEGLEVLDHCAQPAIVFLFFADQEFTLSEESRLLKALLKPLIQRLDVLCNIHVLAEVIIGRETCNSLLQGVKCLLKLLLLLFHCFDKGLFLLFKNGSLVFNCFHDSLRSTKELPFVVIFTACELIMELTADIVGTHAFINLSLELFDGNTDFTEVLFGLCELRNILWWRLDSFCDRSKLGSNSIVGINGSSGNEFGLFVNNLLVFASVHISDVLDVYLEDRDGHRFWNSFLKLFFFRSKGKDVSSEGFCIQWLSIFSCTIQLSDVFVGLKLILFFKLTKCLDILIKWLDRLLKSNFD